MSEDKKDVQPETADKPSGLLELSVRECEDEWELHTFVVDQSDTGVVVQPMVRVRCHGQFNFVGFEVLDGGNEYTFGAHLEFMDGVPTVIVSKRKPGKETYEQDELAMVPLK